MKVQGLLTFWQKPATCPYFEPKNSVYVLPAFVFKMYFNIITQSAPESSKFPLLFTFLPTRTTYVFLFSIRAVCPTNLLLLVIRVIFDEKCKLCSSSLWKFLRSPSTSSFSGPNGFISTLVLKGSAFLLPLIRDTKFHLPIKQNAKLYFCIF